MLLPGEWMVMLQPGAQAPTLWLSDTLKDHTLVRAIEMYGQELTAYRVRVWCKWFRGIRVQFVVLVLVTYGHCNYWL